MAHCILPGCGRGPRVGTLVSHEDIVHAVAILRAGGLVAFPTETVYGLGADARNPAVIRRLFAVKGRPADHPVIVHLARAEMMTAWANHLPPAALTLATAFWPGPLTLVLPRAAHVLALVTGGQETVALRVPSHPVAHELLEAFGDGIVAPSANRFGRLSPTLAAHVRAELGNAVDLILDGGPAEVGVESTIVDLSGDRPAVLRPGGISPVEIAAVLGVPLDAPHANSPRASGTLPSHYAPQTPLEVIQPGDLAERAGQRRAQGSRVAVLARRNPPHIPSGIAWHVIATDAADYAHALYATLREMDEGGYDCILVEDVPESDAWLAVRDRLRRAAYRGEE
ncbi:MAG: threonylcarbamoyl-AMP synthase [Thermomicrobia bacterium]|nr:threonylcarbamoyl-AMP synthase [Thermomicrobia bacterium]